MEDRLEIPDLVEIAAGMLGERLTRAMLVSSAESALATPFATYDGLELYPDPVERAAICCSRMIRHRPFPVGNELVAYECMREMLERGGIEWSRPSEDAAEIAKTIERLAGREISEAEFVAWVRGRTEGG